MGLDMSKYTGSQYLKAADLDGEEHVVTISGAKVATMPDGKQKVVLSTKEFRKGIVLNTTNINTLAEIFGTSDSNKIINKKVCLYTEPVTFGGKTVDGIRIKSLIAATEGRSDEPEIDPENA
jgi:hypothetical protein